MSVFWCLPTIQRQARNRTPRLCLRQGLLPSCPRQVYLDFDEIRTQLKHTGYHKRHPLLMVLSTCLQNLPYRDRLKYQDSQPAKKKGFLTSDFSRRDEFSMTFRTEQYRTQLKQVYWRHTVDIQTLLPCRSCSCMPETDTSLGSARDNQDEQPCLSIFHRKYR